MPCPPRISFFLLDLGPEHLSNLRLLTFWNSALTDAAYQHLREMKSLWELFLGHTQVTPETIEKLKRDLPNCALVL